MPFPPISDTYINIKDIVATDQIDIVLRMAYPLQYTRIDKDNFVWKIQKAHNNARADQTTRFTGGVTANNLVTTTLSVYGGPFRRAGYGMGLNYGGGWAMGMSGAASAEIPWQNIESAWIIKRFETTTPVVKAGFKKIKVIFV